MDNDTADTSQASAKPDMRTRGLPKSEPFVPAGDTRSTHDGDPKSLVALTSEQTTGSAAADADDRSGVFRHLVTADGDIAGLVAYSIYKQNKLDWLNAFDKAKGRAPTADELAAYIIGEGTPRRIATYRHLAEATLSGNGPEIGGDGKGARLDFRRGGILDRRAMTTGLIAAYALIAVLFLIGFLLAAHYTMTSR